MAVQPHECLFIDDGQINVSAALAIGMKGKVYTGVDDVKKYIAEMETARSGIE